MKILLHVCRTPGCVDIIQQDLAVIRRLHNVAVLLERRFEVEKRYFYFFVVIAESVSNIIENRILNTLMHGFLVYVIAFFRDHFLFCVTDRFTHSIFM